jgi:hypothetical protein
MPEQERFERTVDKIRRGGLPTKTDDLVDFIPGTGTACDGCGDVITVDETLYRVSMRGVVQLCFHHECYVAWSTYRP